MANLFDDLAREAARGTSRRDVLRRLSYGFAGFLLHSVGCSSKHDSVRKHDSEGACGACQACNLDTNTCGLPCNPTSAGEALCATVNGDGSYLKLVDYLKNQGFSAAGKPDLVFLYQGGQLIASGLESPFVSAASPEEKATVRYVTAPIYDASVIAIVSRNGISRYALSVNPSDGVVKTVITQGSGPTTTAVLAPQEDEPQAHDYYTRATDPSEQSVVDPVEITHDTCVFLFDNICDQAFVSNIVCYFLITLACAAKAKGPFFVPCEIGLGIVCSVFSTKVCTAAKNFYCKCPFNVQPCEGAPGGCCAPCMDCLNGKCIPNTDCGIGGTCCDNECCAPGNVCGGGKCSPSCCGDICCSDGSYCCQAAGEPVCCLNSFGCCGSTASVCSPPTETCCGDTFCRQGESCCGSGNTAFCCPLGTFCCGNGCCDHVDGAPVAAVAYHDEDGLKATRSTAD